MLKSSMISLRKGTARILIPVILSTGVGFQSAHASNLQVNLILNSNNQIISNPKAFHFLDNFPLGNEKLKFISPSGSGVITVDLQEGKNYVAISNTNNATDTYFVTFNVEGGQLIDFVDNSANDSFDHATLSISGAYTATLNRKNYSFVPQEETFDLHKSNSTKLEIIGVSNLIQSYLAKIEAYKAKIEEMKQIYSDALSSTSEDLSSYKQVMDLLIANQPSSQVAVTRFVLGLNNDSETSAHMAAFATAAATRISIFNSRVLSSFSWLAPFKDSLWRMNTATVNEVNSASQEADDAQELVAQISTAGANAQDKFNELVSKYEITEDESSRIQEYLDKFNSPNLENLDDLSSLASMLDNQLNDYESGLKLKANLIIQILAKIDAIPTQKSLLNSISNQLNTIWFEVELNNASAKVQELKKLSTKLASINASTKSTISCVKGKLTKSVTGINPKCPAGFKKK